MVVFITQIPCAVGQIVAVIGLGAVQCAGLRYGGILVAVHVVRVFAVLLGQPGGAAGALQSGVQQRVAAGHIILAIAVHRNFHAGAALYHIISAGVQVGEHQLAVLNGGAGNKVVFLQHRQVVGFPSAVGEDGGVPDGAAIAGDFGIIHHAGDAVRVLDVLRAVQVIHRAVQRGGAVTAACQIFGGIQIGLAQHDFTQSAVILEHAVLGLHGVAVLVGGKAGGVGDIGSFGGFGGGIDLHGHSTICRFHQNAACIFGQNVSIVIGIVEGDGAAVPGQADVVSAFAKVRASGAGILHICPVAVVTAGGLVFNNKELAIVGEGPAVGVAGHIVIGVVNRVSAGGFVMIVGILPGVAQGILKIETAVLCLRPVGMQTLYCIGTVRVPDKGIVGADFIQSALGVPLI